MSEGKKGSHGKTDAWVKSLNRLALKMDEACDSVHPSCWPYITKDEKAKWKKLAGFDAGRKVEPFEFEVGE